MTLPMAENGQGEILLADSFECICCEDCDPGEGIGQALREAAFRVDQAIGFERHTGVELEVWHFLTGTSVIGLLVLCCLGCLIHRIYRHFKPTDAGPNWAD